nr:twin-arginine translocase TatA/TatE family subunit [Desulfitobacterium metallireducens]
MVIGVIIFGPEDLPDIARTVGKFVYEMKKIFNDATKDLKDVTQDFTDVSKNIKDVIETPSNIINKTIDESVKPVLDMNSTGSKKQNGESQVSKEAEEELLTYDEVDNSSSKPQSKDQDKGLDPLAELPEDMVSYKS